MSVNGIGSVGSQGSVSATTARAPQALPGPALQGGATAAVSGPGRALRDLADLQQGAPERFREVAAAVAQALTRQAQAASGEEARGLQGLADQFSQASQAGDLAPLRPPAGGPPPDRGEQGGESTAVRRYAEQRDGAARGELLARVDGVVQQALQQQGVASAQASASTLAGWQATQRPGT